jgi:type I restriction enzyme R subunit
LGKLYVFAPPLLRRLPVTRGQLPIEIKKNIDVDSLRVRQTSSGKIKVECGTAELEPIGPKGSVRPIPAEIGVLSRIVRDLNQRFGTDFTNDDRVFIHQLETKLAADEALEASVRVNLLDDARLTFDLVANDRIQEMIDSNFKF